MQAFWNAANEDAETVKRPYKIHRKMGDGSFLDDAAKQLKKICDTVLDARRDHKCFDATTQMQLIAGPFSTLAGFMKLRDQVAKDSDMAKDPTENIDSNRNEIEPPFLNWVGKRITN